MSEQLTPRESNEQSSYNYSEHKRLIGEKAFYKAGVEEHLVKAHKMLAGFENLDEVSSRSESERQAWIDEITESVYRDGDDLDMYTKHKLHKRLKGAAQSQFGSAAEGLYLAGKIDGKLKEANIKAAQDYAENQGAYFDAAHAEAMLDGVRIAVQQPPEVAQAVVVRTPQQ